MRNRKSRFVPALFGTGIATDVLYTLLVYVFEDRALHRATFETATINVAMRGWLDKVAGAKLEGEKREGWRTERGGYCDVACYSILGWEWRDKGKKETSSKGYRLELTIPFAAENAEYPICVCQV